jgi:hypothetical protein
MKIEIALGVQMAPILGVDAAAEGKGSSLAFRWQEIMFNSGHSDSDPGDCSYQTEYRRL